MNVELIQFARRHRYHIAEGFCDPGPDTEMQDALDTALENLSEETKDILDMRSAELAEASGIPFDEAFSAFVIWLLINHDFENETFLES